MREFVLPTGIVTATVADGAWSASGVRYRSGPGATLTPGAQQEPAVFPQAPGLLDPLLGPALGELPVREDAFTLRLQGPADLAPDDLRPDERLPVLFFVHGGGFTTGGGEVRWYDAPRLVRRGRFLLVTASYRLGAAAGLLGDGDPVPGGPAWQDLLAALGFVREHVAVFGGDPDRITVAGDSAGAWFAQALSVAEETRGWLAATMLVSLPRMAPLSPRDDRARRELWALALGSGRAFLDAQREVSQRYDGAGFAFAPAAGDALPAWLGDPAVVGARMHTGSLLLVTTSGEASAFLRHLPEETFTPEWLHAAARACSDPGAALAAVGERSGYEAAVALQTWRQFESTAHELAAAAAQAGLSTRVLRLDVESPLPRALSPHCFVLPFLFGERVSWADAPMLDGLPDAVFGHARELLQREATALVTGRAEMSAAPDWRGSDWRGSDWCGPGSGSGRRVLRVTATGFELSDTRPPNVGSVASRKEK